MAVVKFDVSGSDPEKAAKGIGDSPPPGIYLAKIAEMNPGFSKDSEGNPDKTRPRIEVIFHIITGQDKTGKKLGKKYVDVPVWYYLTFGKGFPEQKFDQFLLAVGVASNAKRKGQFKTEEQVGKKVKIELVARKNEPDRTEVKNVFSADGGFDFESEEEEVTGSEEELDLDALATAADDEDDADATVALTTAAAGAGLDPDAYPTWTELATAIAEVQGSEGGEESSDGEVEEEEDLEALGTSADEDDSDSMVRLTELAEEHGLDPDNYATWSDLATSISEAIGGSDGDDGYEEMGVAELKAECESRGLETTGKQATLIKRLRENDNDAPF